MPRWQQISYSVVVIEIMEKVHPGGGGFLASQIFVGIYQNLESCFYKIIFLSRAADENFFQSIKETKVVF